MSEGYNYFSLHNLLKEVNATELESYLKSLFFIDNKGKVVSVTTDGILKFRNRYRGTIFYDLLMGDLIDFLETLIYETPRNEAVSIENQLIIRFASGFWPGLMPAYNQVFFWIPGKIKAESNNARILHNKFKNSKGLQGDIVRNFNTMTLALYGGIILWYLMNRNILDNDVRISWVAGLACKMFKWSLREIYPTEQEILSQPLTWAVGTTSWGIFMKTLIQHLLFSVGINVKDVTERFKLVKYTNTERMAYRPFDIVARTSEKISNEIEKHMIDMHQMFNEKVNFLMKCDYPSLSNNDFPIVGRDF